MSETKKPAWIKPALEFGPILIFFLAYRFAPIEPGATDEARQLSQVLFATAVFIPIILASLALSWWLLKSLPKMAILTAVVVVVFGGLTLWLRDDTFIKMKPTIIYLIFAAVLGFGLMRGQSYLAYMLESALPLSHEGWMTFTKRFALMFVGLAVANEAVWRLTSTDTWVNFKTFGLPVLMMAFMLSQAKLFSEHME
ncbi:inner membrane-spanning protein YciB [Halovulum sp. GXIMD14793]